MPDPQTQTDPNGGALTGQSAGISGGTGFFKNLVGTLVNGALQGGVQALAQAQGTPGQRAMSAGIRAPQIAAQQKAQQQEQADEATLRKQRIAMTQVQLLQAKHALSQADEATQKEYHDTMRGWFDHLYQGGDAEIVGGTAEKQADLMQQLQSAKKQFPNDLVSIAPTGFSTNDHPTFGVYHVKNNSIAEAFDFKFPGHEESGIPPMNSTINAGTNATDGTSQFVHEGRKALVEGETSKLSPSDGLDAPQATPDEVKGYLKSIRKPVPDNFDDLYAIAQGQEPKKELNAKSVRNGKEFVVGKDFATSYIHNFSPKYQPDQMANTADIRKTLEKAEGNFAQENGKNAGQAIEDAKNIIERKGGGSPELVQRAQKLIDKAKPWDDRYQKSLKAKDDNKDFEHQKTLFDQRQNDGVDQRGQRLTLDEADETQPVDGFGNPIPNKKISAYKPGQMQQQTAATANTLIEKLGNIESQIKAHANYVGPIGGTIGELKAHFGLGDKEAQKLYDDITTSQSGFTKMHTSRFSKEILDKATTMLNAKMNVQQALGAIESMRETAQIYAKDDKLVSKADYLQTQAAQRDRAVTKAQSYLQRAGWTGGKPTDEQKQKAQALAQSEGQAF
jgi:hypothetical protein